MENEKSTIRWYGAEKMWDALKNSFKTWKKKDDGDHLSFNEEKKNEFIDKFAEYYESIKSQYMSVETEELDAHKQAAIMVISALETGVIEQSCGEDEVPLGPQAVILDVAVSFLLVCINKKLKDIGIKPIKFKFPIALACETSYFDVLRRILYYESPNVEKQMSYNVLEWSDRFFLLEYITLLENGIDPRLVKDSLRES